MKRTVTIPVWIIAVVMLAVGGLTAVGCQSATEQFNDASISFKDDSPMEVYNAPDGFSNFATKCDRFGNRVYVTKDDTGRALAVVPADPTCPPYQNEGGDPIP